MFNFDRFTPTMIRLSLRLFVILVVISISVVAETSGQSVSNLRVLRGRIIDADSGQPVTEQLTLVVSKEGGGDSRAIKVTGDFSVSDVTPGRYELMIRYQALRFTRTVQVSSLPEVTVSDFYVRLPGKITGVILDTIGEPVQGSKVMLVYAEYMAGHAIYTTSDNSRKTDDRGHFTLSGVDVSHPYFLLALPPESDRPKLSGTSSLVATWYPNRPEVSQPFVLRSAEEKRVDLVIEEKKTRCADGMLTKNGQPGQLNFEIAVPETAGYIPFTGGTLGVIFTGQSDTSGHFQACGLWPGEFLIATGLNGDSYGRVNVTIADQDLHDVRVNAQSPITLKAEIHSDSEATPKTFLLQFIPVNRVAFESPTVLFSPIRVVVPSQFSISLLPSTEYRITGAFYPISSKPEEYVKEVMCGGTVRSNSFNVGDADCSLRIMIGTDMGKLSAAVIDKDNKNDLNSSVCVFPPFAATREEVASTATCSAVDPETATVSISLRPERYIALPVPPEAINWVDYIMANRGLGTPIDIKAHSAIPLTLKSSKGRGSQ